MLHQQLNSIFAQYTPTLYNAANRMIDKRHPQFEDKVQDLVVLAYEEFTRKANEGKIMDLPLVIHYMKFRKAEVQIEMRGYSRTSKTDVFNKRNYYEGKMELYSIHNPVFDGEGDTYADVIPHDKDVEDELNFNIDLQRQLSVLTKTDRTIFEMKVAGFDDEAVVRTLSIQPHTLKVALDRISHLLIGKPQPQLELIL